MGEFLHIGCCILFFVGLPIGLGFLFYFVSKKLGYPKTGKYLTIICGLVVLTIVFFISFEEKKFNKNEALVLVEEQGFKLTDSFDLVENKSMSAIGDYYYTFTLKISKRDKQNTISKIKNADNFKTNNSSIESLHLLSQNIDRYFGTKVIQNYEDKFSYIRECFKPSGLKGYSPIFRRVSISKTKDELTFEDIDE